MKNATNKQITEMTRKRTQEEAENKTKTKHWWENYWFWDWLTLIFSFIFNLKPVFFCQILHLLFICVRLYIFSETITSVCSTGHCTYRAFYMHMDRVPPWTVKQSSFISWWDHRSSMSCRLWDWHWILQAPFGFHQIIHTSHAAILYANPNPIPNSAITETTVKQRPLAFTWFDFHWETPGSVGFSELSLVWKTRTS